MPTYEYRCKKCGIVFEAFQAISEKPLSKCTEDVCPLQDSEKGTGEVERLISAGAGVMFKGSGFYITDYKAAKPEQRSSGKSETKPSASPAKPASDGSSASTNSTKEKTNKNTAS
ncbi:MAG TPA: zinc ribbon domain-containing protein [Candidatus Kapabacteria bacterium]|nr:zinc ribbon domain-containing protein [Candidatus Kapabacteria bacterium]